MPCEGMAGTCVFGGQSDADIIFGQHMAQKPALATLIVERTGAFCRVPWGAISLALV